MVERTSIYGGRENSVNRQRMLRGFTDYCRSFENNKVLKGLHNSCHSSVTNSFLEGKWRDTERIETVVLPENLCTDGCVYYSRVRHYIPRRELFIKESTLTYPTHYRESLSAIKNFFLESFTRRRYRICERRIVTPPIYKLFHYLFMFLFFVLFFCLFDCFFLWFVLLVYLPFTFTILWFILLIFWT